MIEMKRTLLIWISVIAIGAIVTGITVTYLISYMVQDVQTIEAENKVESYTPGYIGDGYFTLDNMSRSARYIVIGTVVDEAPNPYQVRDKIEEYHSGITVNIDIEITGMYNDKMIHFVGPSTKWVKVGDKILVFLADKEPDSVWGDNYYIIGGLYGLFKVIEDKVYGEILPEGLALEDAIKVIEEARANRIKNVSLNAKYIVIGKISDIARENQYSDLQITVDVEEELTGNYSEKRITLLIAEIILKHWGKGRVGERYLFFVRDDSSESINASYSISKSGIYYINEDNIAIGHEFPEGIPIEELEAKIINFRRGF